MRRLVLAALSPALIASACDDMPTSQSVDIDAADASVINAPIIDRSAHVSLTPPVIVEPARRRSPEPVRKPTVVELNAARAHALTLVNPLLAVVPGLAESVARGALAPTDALALPAGVAELTGAPWLILEGRLIVASGDHVLPEWASGTARLLQAPKTTSDGLDFVATRGLAQTEIPSAMRALVGATIKVFDREHEVCVARVSGLSLEARMSHSGEWDDNGDVRLPVHTASEVFDSGVSIVLADLVPVSGSAADCAKGVWAAPVEATRPVLFRKVDMDSSLAKPAVRAFRKLASYTRAQTDFSAFYNDEKPETGRWDATVEHNFGRFVSDDGAREVLVVNADTWDGCGSNGQTLTALFDVVKIDGKTTLAPITSRAWAGMPNGLVDIDADGVLELLQSEDIVRWTDAAPPSEDNGWVDATYEQLERFAVPSLGDSGCGC